MLACQSCQTSLLLYSSITSIDEFLKELETTLDTPYLDPSYRTKLAHDITHGTYKFLDCSTKTDTPVSPLITSSDNDRGLELQLHQLGKLLSLLVDLTLLDHPICAKCCYELSSRLAQYCDILQNELQEVKACTETIISIRSSLDKLFGLYKPTTDTNPEDSHTTVDGPNLHSTTQPAIEPESSTDMPKGQQIANPSASDSIDISQQFHQHTHRRFLAMIHEEEQLQKEIDALDQSLIDLDINEQKLVMEERHIQELQSNYYRTFIDLQFNTSQYTAAAASLTQQIHFISQTTELLHATNPYFDLFQIDLISPVPSISGFRLGRIESVPVEFDEINMALGQVALLVEILRKNLKFEFQQFSIFVNSHQSKIFRRIPHVSLSSTTTGGGGGGMTSTATPSVVEFLLYIEKSSSKFGSSTEALNRGLESLLQCIDELYRVAHTRAEKSSITMPNPPTIDNHRINGHSVRLSRREESKWTLAMKEILQALHFVICLVVTMGYDAHDRRNA